jgi:hypothetical protein
MNVGEGSPVIGKAWDFAAIPRQYLDRQVYGRNLMGWTPPDGLYGKVEVLKHH